MSQREESSCGTDVEDLTGSVELVQNEEGAVGYSEDYEFQQHHGNIYPGIESSSIQPYAFDETEGAVGYTQPEAFDVSEGGAIGYLRAYETEQDMQNIYPRFEALTLQEQNPVILKYGILKTNCFKVERSTWNLVQYHVTFFPVVEDPEVAIKIIYDEFDIEEFLYEKISSTLTLIQEMATIFDKELVITDVNGTPIMKMEYEYIVPVDDIRYDIFFAILREKIISNTDWLNEGSSIFDVQNKTMISTYLTEIWKGLQIYFRKKEEGTMLILDITTKVMQNYSMLNELYYEMRKKFDLEENFKQTFIGREVKAKFDNYFYKIVDIDFLKSPLSTFMYDGPDGTREVTYVDYYKDKYHVTVNDEDQPLLLCQRKLDKSLVYMIPEFCFLEGLTETIRDDQELMNSIRSHTDFKPQQRSRDIMVFKKKLFHENAGMDMMIWNLAVPRNTGMMEVPCKFLHDVTVYLRDTAYSSREISDWNMKLEIGCLRKAPNILPWAVICSRVDIEYVEEFFTPLHEKMKSMGCYSEDPVVETFLPHQLNPRDFEILIDKICRQKNCKRQLIVCILPGFTITQYAAIKKTSIRNKVACQVIRRSTFRKRENKEILNQMSLQLCAKLNGIPWTVDFPSQHILCIGYAVEKDNIKPAKKFVCTVAGIDVTKNHFFSIARQCSEGLNLYTVISDTIKNAIKKFSNVRGALPETVIIFRDDNSNNYVPSIDQAMAKQELYETYENSVSFVFIDVKESVTEKFFGTQYQNPPHGTMVDSIITSPFRNDFYLISDAAANTTRCPAYFNIVSNNSSLKRVHLADLSYRLAHLYYNTGKPIGIPCVLKYVQKFSYLVTNVLHDEPGNDMEDSLYYL